MYLIIRRQEAKAAWRNAPSVIHQDIIEAASEAQRLAEISVGNSFDVFELVKVGSALGTVEVNWEEFPKRRKRK